MDSYCKINILFTYTYPILDYIYLWMEGEQIVGTESYPRKQFFQMLRIRLTWKFNPLTRSMDHAMSAFCCPTEEPWNQMVFFPLLWNVIMLSIQQGC